MFMAGFVLVTIFVGLVPPIDGDIHLYHTQGKGRVPIAVVVPLAPGQDRLTVRATYSLLMPTFEYLETNRLTPAAAGVVSKYARTHARVNGSAPEVVHPFMEVFWAGAKGWGVRVLEDVAAGALLGYYVGLVITADMMDTAAHNSSLYLWELGRKYHLCRGNQLVIEASHHGSFTRLINHSCEPNCCSSAMFFGDCCTRSYYNVGLFTSRAVAAYDELLLHYGDSYFVDGQVCLCGSSACLSRCRS